MPSDDKLIVYWDSCVFIDQLQQTPGRYECCNAIHERAEGGEVLIVTSTVTIAEVARLPNAGGTLPLDKSKQILEYFENPYIVLRQVDRNIAESAHQLCRDYGLIHLDAIHLATALKSGVSVLYTFDSKKQRRKGLLKYNSKFGSPPLAIEVPPVPPPAPPPSAPLFDLPLDDGLRSNGERPN